MTDVSKRQLGDAIVDNKERTFSVMLLNQNVWWQKKLYLFSIKTTSCVTLKHYAKINVSR